jgi:hypothetical protein
MRRGRDVPPERLYERRGRDVPPERLYERRSNQQSKILGSKMLGFDPRQ